MKYIIILSITLLMSGSYLLYRWRKWSRSGEPLPIESEVIIVMLIAIKLIAAAYLACKIIYLSVF